MPRLITDEQEKEFEKNPMGLSLGSILSWKDMQDYAEEKLTASRFLSDFQFRDIDPMPSSSKVTIMLSKTIMGQDIDGTYSMEIAAEIYPHERIFRAPGTGQRVYLNDAFLGTVKNTTAYKSQSYADNKVLAELELDYPGRDSLFLRMMKLSSKFEARIDSSGIHFGSGSDFEDLARVTLEEHKQRELRMERYKFFVSS